MQEMQHALIQHLARNPHEIKAQHTSELNALAEAYQASNFVHILYAKSVQETPEFEEALGKAAVFASDRKILFHLIHQPEKLFGENSLNEEETLPPNFTRTADASASFTVEQHSKSEYAEPSAEPEPLPSEGIAANDLSEDGDEVDTANADVVAESQPDAVAEITSEQVSVPGEQQTAIDDEVFDEIAETPFTYVNRINESEIPDGETPQVAAESGEIDDEVFEEISEASFTGEKNGASDVPPGESPQHAAESNLIDDEVFDEINETSFPESPLNRSEETPAQDPVIKPVESFHIESVIPVLEELPSAQNIAEPVSGPSNQASRYHDDKMPYSFMWWLDKTRQEHAQTYQPYASPFRPDPASPVENLPAPLAKEPLEQQYIEHIFHLRSVEELEQSTTQPQTVPFSVDKKETKIIEKFIREEPQISTPRPEKLDVENKARKSTEDKLDMVSETLARIYTEQMLYHKAIDTYQKLRLKYPDKSSYFAARIDELEQKIR